MSVKLGIVGDFRPESPSHLATNDAITHAADTLSIDMVVTWVATDSLASEQSVSTLSGYDGLWIAPGSPYRNMDGALSAIRFGREARIPVLGTCGGFQHLVLEYARNCLGFTDAEHAEHDPYASNLFISKLDCSLVGRNLEVKLKPKSITSKLYGTDQVTEGYYCNFGVNPQYDSVLEASELKVVGSDTEGRVRVVELENHPFFIGTLYVPQHRSEPGKPHPLVVGFACAAQVRKSQC